MPRHNLNLSDEAWRIATDSGNASAYIEQAVKARYLSEIRDEANAIVAAMPQSEVDDWLTWGASIADQATRERP